MYSSIIIILYNYVIYRIIIIFLYQDASTPSAFQHVVGKLCKAAQNRQRKQLVALMAALDGDLVLDDDLVLDGEDDFVDDQPMFQKAAHEGDGAAMVAKEADKETAANKGIEAAPTLNVAARDPPPSAENQGRPMAKVVIVGDSGVGKTSLQVRFTDSTFREATRATVGIDMATRELPLPSGGSIRMQLWDTAGQEHFKALTASYFRQAHGVILVYDVHDRSSFVSLSRWMVEVDCHCPAEVVKMVVGCKCDDGDHGTAVSASEASSFAAKHGALCERCSAKADSNIMPAFEALAAKMIRNGFKPDGVAQAKQGIHVGTSAPKKGKKGGCC